MDTLKFFSSRKMSKFDRFGSNWYWLEQFEDYFTQVVFFFNFEDCQYFSENLEFEKENESNSVNASLEKYPQEFKIKLNF